LEVLFSSFVSTECVSGADPKCECFWWFAFCRNANVYGNGSSATGQARLLDLHGLHVNEAIPVLKREIAQLRLNVRSTQQREQVFICVGTGHHTKGSRTPARLPIAVQRYLAEEHLPFTETQPGMLRVIVRWPRFSVYVIVNLRNPRRNIIWHHWSQHMTRDSQFHILFVMWGNKHIWKITV
jgi:hypothetical protein